MNSLLHLPLLNVLNEEPEGIEPGQENVLEHVANSLLLKPQRFPSHNGGVDQVQPGIKRGGLQGQDNMATRLYTPEGICSKFIDNLHGVWIVLQSLAHLPPI